MGGSLMHKYPQLEPLTGEQEAEVRSNKLWAKRVFWFDCALLVGYLIANNIQSVDLFVQSLLGVEYRFFLGCLMGFLLFVCGTLLIFDPREPATLQDLMND